MIPIALGVINYLDGARGSRAQKFVNICFSEFFFVRGVEKEMHVKFDDRFNISLIFLLFSISFSSKMMKNFHSTVLLRCTNWHFFKNYIPAKGKNRGNSAKLVVSCRPINIEFSLN